MTRGGWGWSRSPCRREVSRRGGAGAGPSGRGRDAVDKGEGLSDVVDVGRSGDDFERGAASVADQVVFAARPPPVDRRRTGVGSPFFRADVGAVHAHAGPVEFAGRVEFGEQCGAAGQDPSLLPAVQVPPACLAGAEPQLQGKELPGYVVGLTGPAGTRSRCGPVLVRVPRQTATAFGTG